MTPLILLAVVASIPLLQALFLRVNTICVFLSIAVGELLVRSVGDDLAFMIGAIVKSQNSAVIAQITLLLLPLLLSFYLMRHTLPRSRILLHALPLAGSGIMLAIFILPLLPSSIQGQVLNDPTGKALQHAQDVIVAVTAIATLVLMWLTGRHHEPHHGRKHH